MTSEALISLERIAGRILVLRGHRVLVDTDLSALYGVKTKRLNEQVKRNVDRFPSPEFVFQLTAAEKAEVVANCDHLRALKFSPGLPHVFTEYGALMAAAVLNTPVAVQVSLQVVRAFVRLRQLLDTNESLGRRVATLERKCGAHDAALRALADAFRGISGATPPASKRRRIGFEGGGDNGASGSGESGARPRTRARAKPR